MHVSARPETARRLLSRTTDAVSSHLPQTARACLSAWAALLTLSAVAGATIVTGPPQPYCDIENTYGASMAVLGDRHVVVGSAGESAMRIG